MPFNDIPRRWRRHLSGGEHPSNPCSRFNPISPKASALRQADGLELHQFEHREEQADHAAAAALPLEQFARGDDFAAALRSESVCAQIANHVRA